MTRTGCSIFSHDPDRAVCQRRFRRRAEQRQFQITFAIQRRTVRCVRELPSTRTGRFQHRHGRLRARSPDRYDHPRKRIPAAFKGTERFGPFHFGRALRRVPRSDATTLVPGEQWSPRRLRPRPPDWCNDPVSVDSDSRAASLRPRFRRMDVTSPSEPCQQPDYGGNNGSRDVFCRLLSTTTTRVSVARPACRAT